MKKRRMEERKEGRLKEYEYLFGKYQESIFESDRAGVKGRSEREA